MSLLITLGVPAVLFIAFERIFALRPQRVFRAGWRTDLCHALFDAIPAGAVLGILRTSVGGVLRDLTPDAVRTTIGALPFLLELALVVVICELGMYWSHRIEHESPFLWRFHAVHHSSPELDWLATQRNHPIDGIFRKAFLVPVYAVGFSTGCLAIYLAAYYIWSFVLHANVRWRFGSLEAVVASPIFHRWHHADDLEARNTNYSPIFSLTDRIFGTLHRSNRIPSTYGIDTPMPSAYVGQLAEPFRSRQTASTA